MATNARPIGEVTLALAAELRARRSRKRITQPAFVELAQIPLSTLSQLENGRAAFDAEQIARIATAFGTTPGAFVDEAIANAEAQPADAREVGPLVRSRGSVTGRSTDEEHAKIEDWAESRQRKAQESSTPSPPESSATEDR